jgi:Tfp pilus assembly protein PilX
VNARRRVGVGDRGAILPLVLVFVVVLGLVLAGTARYTATNLRYSAVAQDRAAASASAEAALRLAIQRVGANAVATCDGGPVTIVPTHDPSVDPILADADNITITCSRLDSGQATLSGWAAVITADGIGSANDLEIDEQGPHAATGRIFMSSLRQSDLRINVEDVTFDGNLFYDGSSDDCATIDHYSESSASWDDDIVMTSGSFVCWPQTWDEVVDEPPIANLPAHLPGNPAWTMIGSCRVFEPGWYHQLELNVGGDNYFRSGAYVFEDVLIDTSYDPVTMTTASGTTILAGYGDDSSFDTRLATGSSCEAAQAFDALDGPAPLNPGTNGVTWYFGGSSRLLIDSDTTIEMIPMLIDDGVRRHAVSLHVLGPGSTWPSTLGDGVDVVEEGNGTGNRALFQGQIWAPSQPIDLYQLTGDTNGQITSGVVAAQILVDSTNGSVGALGPDRTPVDHELLLSATATVDGVKLEARAVVEHRPGAAVGSRVAVRSIRIVD